MLIQLQKKTVRGNYNEPNITIIIQTLKNRFNTKIIVDV